MMSVRVNFEIGHQASIRSKCTPEGFTHDWEVFVRGCDSDPSHFIDRVVFHLHETFQKPKRAFKEPPYSVKESGYAGFVIPIDIYLKNKDEPKKIHFKYDLNLQTEGPAITRVQKEKYIFHNPSDDFKKRLMKGGGILVNSSIEPEKIKENETKLQLTGKPKSGADMMKKHKPKEHRSDEPKISSFAHLFGTPINTGSKASPDPKKTSPIPPKSLSASVLPSKKDERLMKEKNDKSKSKLSPSKEKDYVKNKEAQEKAREDKRKNNNKDRDRSKEKLSKTAISPRPKSPKRSSPSLTNSAINRVDLEQQKVKVDNIDIKKGSEQKDRKLKKEKKGHDRDKKDHKREKDREKDVSKELKLDQKGLLKDKELQSRDILVKEKPREKEKSSAMKINDTVKTDPDPKILEAKTQDKRDVDRRHKHKKKDKSRKDDSKMDRDKDKKNKAEKIIANKPIRDDIESFQSDETAIKVDHENPPEPNTADTLSDLPSSDTEESIKSIDEPIKHKTDAIINSPLNDLHYNNIEKQKEKVLKKHKDKSKNFEKEEKRRKRKSKDDHSEKSKFAIQQASKLVKLEEEVNSDMEVESLDAGENIEQNRPDEPVSMELTDTGDTIASPSFEEKAFTPDYMSELKELQHKIMTLQDNTEIQDIVQMVAETGQFEITKKTFDFDLCTLDRSTVQRLQEFFASS